MDELERRRRQLSDPDAYLKALNETPVDNFTPVELAQLKSSQAFENELENALNLPVTEKFAEEIILNQRLKNRKRRVSNWAIAASLATVSLIGSIMINTPDEVLPQEALAHIYQELDHMFDNQVISPEEVERRLEQAKISLPSLPDKVVFISICQLAGDDSMHIVAEIDGKPVTLMITAKSVEDYHHFGDQRFIGRMRKLATTNLVMIAEDLSLVDKLFEQITGV